MLRTSLWFRVAPAVAVPAAPAAAPAAGDDRATQAEVKALAEVVRRLKLEMSVPEAVTFGSYQGMGMGAPKVHYQPKGLSIGGYGEFVYTNYADDRADFVEILRLVLYVRYRFNDKIVFNSEIEFEHGTTSSVNNGTGGGSIAVEFAALDFFWRPEASFRVGHVLVPMGFVNEIHEPPFFYGVQRPETEVRILPSTWRENGLCIFGSFGESLEVRSYLLAGFDAQNFSDAGIRGGRQQGNRSLSEDFAWVTRMDFTPEALPGFLLGGAVYFSDSGQDIDTANGELPSSRLWIFEGHSEYKRGPLSARALFAFTILSDSRELNEVLERPIDAPVADEMLGGYAELGYDVYPWLFGDEARQLEPFVRGMSR